MRWAVAAVGLGLPWFTLSIASANPASERPRITLEALLDRPSVTVEDLQWLGSDHLIARFDDARDQEPMLLKLSHRQPPELIRRGSHVSVSPDGELLLYYSGKGWAVANLRADPNNRSDSLSTFDGCKPKGRAVWSDDSRYAAFVECNGHYLRAGSPTTHGSEVAVDAGELVWRQAGSRIAIFDRERPTELQRIEIDDFALAMAWGRHGELYVTVSALLSGDASTGILRIQSQTLAAVEIYRTPGRFQSMRPEVHPDGDRIALVLDVDHRTWDDFQSLILIEASTGTELHRITNNLPLFGDDYYWSKEGHSLYARVKKGGLDQIYEVPLTGRPRPLTTGLRRHYDMTLSPDGRKLAYQTEDGYGRKDIRVLDTETAEEDVVLVLDNPERDYHLGRWYHIRWESSDSIRPYGLLFLPPDFLIDRQYPLLVTIHGGGEGSRLYLRGPFTSTVAPGPLEWHVWAAQGYVVFVPDYRSTGDYGPEPIKDRYEQAVPAAVTDIEDVLSGTQAVVRGGFVDPGRIAVLGHSAGGMRAFLLLTRTSLFTAAVLNEPIEPDPATLVVNKLSGENTGADPFGILRQMFGGGLSEVPERYKVNYLFDAWKIETPTLIMLGNESLGGVSHRPYEVVYSILKHHAVPARLLKFSRDTHTYQTPKAAKRAFEETLNWLDAHLAEPM